MARRVSIASALVTRLAHYMPVRQYGEVDGNAVFGGGAMPGIVATLAPIMRVLVSRFGKDRADFLNGALVELVARVARRLRRAHQQRNERRRQGRQRDKSR